MSRSERLALRLGQAFSSRCDLLVANSSLGLRQLLQLGYRPRATELIRNGVELPDSLELARWRREIRTSLAIAEDRPLILAVGSIHLSKGPGTLLEAVRRASHALPEAMFVRVGRDAVGIEATPEAESLMRSPLVRSMGEVPSALPWMAAADVLVLSSRREGCPNVVLEAMACGCPVAATQVGDVAELVGPCGSTVPVGDGTALGDAIVRLARIDEDDRLQMAELARERIRVGHDRKQVAETYVDRYRALTRLGR
jgi:glycosyltransferase involved in cell wall biosynthesis